VDVPEENLHKNLVSCTSFRTNSEKEKDKTCGRIEKSRSDVAWGPELHHRSHQERNGRRKVEISGLHA
jgi:hypothetical protein